MSHEEAEGGERPAHARLAARLARRAISFPLLLVVWAAALLALGGLPLALLGDLALRRRLAACRALLALAALASAEVLGVLAALGLGLGAPFVSRARFRGWNARLQRAWVEGLWAGVRRLYGLRLRVEGGPVAPDAPLLVLVRHTSLIDTLLPLLVLEPRFELRWVLKQELLWDPCLDLVGLRLPNVFVSRDGGQSEREAARVAALARAIGPGQAVVIYPEGTRFSPARRERVLENLARAGGPAGNAQAGGPAGDARAGGPAGDARAGGPAGDVRARTPTSRLLRARALTHVLPPRPGGVLGLLAACPEADVLVVAHTGLEGARTLASLWRGELIGREVRVASWRVAARAVPLDPAARQDWLLGQWERLNAWVAAAA